MHIVELSLYGVIIKVEFASSAFKHGCTKDDMLSVISNNVYDETLHEDPKKTLVIGFDRKGRLIELVFNALSDQHIVVFHAMTCRKIYRDRIGKRRSNA